MMVILGHEHESRHDQYWVAVANRRAYAQQHNLPLYLVTGSMGSGEHPAWEKLVALQAVLKHSCAQWVWMSDADAYIMNIKLDVLDLANNPWQHSNPKQLCTTNTPDIIAAGACLTRINTGSMLWRNTAWTQQFIADAWHSKFIARPANWWDQAAILHMYKIGDNRLHTCIVKQRSINAFPNMTKCHDGGGTFQVRSHSWQPKTDLATRPMQEVLSVQSYTAPHSTHGGGGAHTDTFVDAHASNCRPWLMTA
jgi:hypothetical protein